MELLPILGGFLLALLFIPAAIIVRLIPAARYSSSLRKLSLIFAYVGILGLAPTVLLMLRYRPVSRENVIGIYRGEFGGGVNVITIHRNGTVDQSFTTSAHGTLHQKGTWSIDHGTAGDTLNLNKVLLTMRPDNSGYPPEVGSIAGVNELYDGSLLFDDDQNVTAKRIGDAP